MTNNKRTNKHAASKRPLEAKCGSRISDEAPWKNLSPSDLEEKYVKEVYQTVSSAFANTRRTKPWPVVTEFLKNLPAGSLVLDCGCGSGRYFWANTNISMICSDFSTSLLDEAKANAAKPPVEELSPSDASFVAANILDLPFQDETFDALICIAVIHHLASPERRQRAVDEIHRVLKKGGKALIFVWAQERKNCPEHDQGDTLVSWHFEKRVVSEDVLKKVDALDQPKYEVTKEDGDYKVVHRYYHLFHENELETLIENTNSTIIDKDWTVGNWYSIFQK